MIDLVEIIIIFAIIFTNIISLFFAQKTSSKLIGILISTLFLILFSIISFSDFIIVRDLVFVLTAFFITILLLFFIPKISNQFHEKQSQKPNIFQLLVIFSAFCLFIFIVLNIDNFQKEVSASIANKEKFEQDKIFVSSHANDKFVKQFYESKKSNLEKIAKQQNVQEFQISNYKILQEKLSENRLLYRFSEIVLLVSMFISILFIFGNKKHNS